MTRWCKVLALSLALLLLVGSLTACGDLSAAFGDPPFPDSGAPSDPDDPSDPNDPDDPTGNIPTQPVPIRPMYLYDGENRLRLESDGRITASGSLADTFHGANYSAVLSVGMNNHCAYVLTEGGGLYLVGSNEKGMLCDDDLTKTYTTAKRIVFDVNASSFVLHFAMSETFCAALTRDSLYVWGELYDKRDEDTLEFNYGTMPWEGISSTPFKLDLPRDVAPSDVTHLSVGPEGVALSVKGTTYYWGNYITGFSGEEGHCWIDTAYTQWSAFNGIKSAHGKDFQLFLQEDGSVFVRGMPGFQDLTYTQQESFPGLIQYPVWLYTPVSIQDIAVYGSGAALLGEDGSVYVIGKLGKNTYSTLQRVIVPSPMSWVGLNAYGLMMANADDEGFAFSYTQLRSELRPVFN